MNKDRLVSILKIVATILIVVFSLYFAFRNVDFDELVRSFKTANYWLVLLTLPISLLSHWVRAMRWKVILRYIHSEISTWKLFSGVMVGYFMNNIIPRSGELAKPYVTAQGEEKASFSSLLGSVVVERFVDTISLLIIVAVILLFDDTLFNGFEELGLSKSVIQAWLYPAIIIGVVFILIAPSKWGTAIARFCLKPVPEKFATKIFDIFTKLQKGFGCLQSFNQVLIVVVESAVIYGCYMLPLYILFYAFPSIEHISPTMFDAMKMLAITAAAMTVAPTPGGFGVFHFAAKVAAIKIVGFSDADAIAYGTLAHFGQYLVVMTIGGYFLITRNLSVKELKQAKS
jgi:glycosyltransferase 2 family protein